MNKTNYKEEIDTMLKTCEKLEEYNDKIKNKQIDEKEELNIVNNIHN